MKNLLLSVSALALFVAGASSSEAAVYVGVPGVGVTIGGGPVVGGVYVPPVVYAPPVVRPGYPYYGYNYSYPYYGGRPVYYRGANYGRPSGGHSHGGHSHGGGGHSHGGGGRR